jgi:hypothetical protein
MGSWLEGPPSDDEGLGLPEQGSGSRASLGRRVLALAIDWLACLLISASFFGGDPMATLGIFALENLVLVALVGATLGHRIAGLQVRRLEVAQGKVEQLVGGVGLVRSLVRALLLCLVIPAVVWDSEGRSLHDRFAGTVITRR